MSHRSTSQDKSILDCLDDTSHLNRTQLLTSENPLPQYQTFAQGQTQEDKNISGFSENYNEQRLFNAEENEEITTSQHIPQMEVLEDATFCHLEQVSGYESSAYDASLSYENNQHQRYDPLILRAAPVLCDFNEPINSHSNQDIQLLGDGNCNRNNERTGFLQCQQGSATHLNMPSLELAHYFFHLQFFPAEEERRIDLESTMDYFSDKQTSPQGNEDTNSPSFYESMIHQEENQNINFPHFDHIQSSQDSSSFIKPQEWQKENSQHEEQLTVSSENLENKIDQETLEENKQIKRKLGIRKSPINYILVDYKNNARRYHCEFCDDFFKNHRALGGHVSRKHAGQSQKYALKQITRKSREHQRKIHAKALSIYNKKYLPILGYLCRRILEEIKEDLKKEDKLTEKPKEEQN